MLESWTWIDDSLQRILIGREVGDLFVDGRKPDGLELDHGLEPLKPGGQSFASVVLETVVVVDGSFVVDDDVQQSVVGQLEHCDQESASLPRDE